MPLKWIFGEELRSIKAQLMKNETIRDVMNVEVSIIETSERGDSCGMATFHDCQRSDGRNEYGTGFIIDDEGPVDWKKLET